MQVLPGENIWLLVRTDRDAASESQVLDTVGPAMSWFLREGQPGTFIDKFGRAVQTRAEEAIRTGLFDWRVGAARPIRVSQISQASMALPAGQLLGSRATADPQVLPTVRATRPWFIRVDFWWRGPSATIPYPALKVSDFGVRSRELVDADWFLDRAVQPSEPQPDPGAESWVDAQSERAGEAISEFADDYATAVKLGAALVALVSVAYIVGKVR